jgi:hypothetical protein
LSEAFDPNWSSFVKEDLKVFWAIFRENLRKIAGLITHLEKSCSGSPISLLRLDLLWMQTISACLVLGGVYSTRHSKQSNFYHFSKFAENVPLWKIISRDPLGRFWREYACWKGQIVFFQDSVRYIFHVPPDLDL